MGRREKTSNGQGLNVQSWKSTFPSMDNEKDRLRFLARMGYLSISHYLLYRNIVPIGVYRRRRVEDFVIYCFDSTTRWGRKLSEMMLGLKDGIEKKYVESAFIMINDNKENKHMASEVFTVQFCYKEEHSFNILDDKGQPIVTLSYKDELSFRNQTKHILKKLSAVTKRLKKLKPDSMPYMKLTYYPEMPNDYEAPFYMACDETYKFETKPTFYDYGYISTNTTAVAFHLQSTYVKQEDIAGLEDALFDEAGITHGQLVNISMDCQSGDDNSSPNVFSPIIEPNFGILDAEVQRVEEPVFDHGIESPPQSEESLHIEPNFGILDAEVQRTEEHVSDHGIESPPRSEESLQIEPDETIEASPNERSSKTNVLPHILKGRVLRKRILTPPTNNRTYVHKVKHKTAVLRRDVIQSPEDATVYANANGEPLP